MEMVRDQGEKATAGWTGFMGRPTTKETAQRSINLLSKRWFYTQVNFFTSLPHSTNFFAVHLNLVSLQKRKKMPPLPPHEEGHALTHEAKELELTSSEEARLVTNM